MQRLPFQVCGRWSRLKSAEGRLFSSLGMVPFARILLMVFVSGGLLTKLGRHGHDVAAEGELWSMRESRQVWNKRSRRGTLVIAVS